MANVTYLLGAGASCNALPTYKNFGERFEKFALLFSLNTKVRGELSPELQRRADRLHELLTTFQKQFEYHNTPDTIAKKLYHIGSTYDGLNLKTVKQLLVLFFLYEQIVTTKGEFNDMYKGDKKDVVDKRYDLLLAGLIKPIENKIEFLPNFKILTWNYDIQLEKTCANYIGNAIAVAQKVLQSYPQIERGNDVSFDSNRFAIVHLNGIAYSRVYGGGTKNEDCLSGTMEFSAQLAEYLLNVFKCMNTYPNDNYFENLLTFAWENVDNDYNIIKSDTLTKAVTIAQQTEILVIIGYSFPIFNSAIDSDLLKNMHRLRKIYIQSPDGPQIKRLLMNTYFSGEIDHFIEDVGYTNPFYIPNEWNYTSFGKYDYR